MTDYAFVDLDGYPVSAGSLPNGFSRPENSISILRSVDPALVRWDGKTWQARSTVTIVATKTGAEVRGAAAGLTVHVLDAGTGAHLAGADISGIDPVLIGLPTNCDAVIIAVVEKPWLGAERRIQRGVGSPIVAAQILQAARDAAVQQINDATTNVRRRFVTDIPGQEALYLEKRDEAVAYLAANPEPTNLADYALLASEVGITAPTAYQLAQVWINRAHLFRLVGGLTENMRMTAMNAVAVATDDAAISAAIEACQQSLTAIPKT